jgi:hypothetical protein
LQRIIALTAAVFLFFLSSAAAQVVERPVIKAEDSWTYTNTIEQGTHWRQTHDESSVIRASETQILLSNKESGSKLPPKEVLSGPDWSRFRSINGHEQVVNRPFVFPLSPGKTWELEYTEDHPNRAHDRETFHSTYKVVGWEEVKVPAGTFSALKVEAEGHWTADLAPAVSASEHTRADNQGTTTVMRTDKTAPQTATGRLYKAFWYVPEVKRHVKAIEEYFGPNGVRNERYTLELDSFKVQ